MFIDSHCHLDFSCFERDLDSLIERCFTLGVERFVVPSTTYASWQRVQHLQKAYSSIGIGLGLHPYFLAGFEDWHLQKLEQALATAPVIALGEIGLDNWPNSPDYLLQKKVFVEQLKLAKQWQLPVILHARKSEDDLLKILRQNDFQNGGIVHAFNGSLDQAKRFIDLGFVLGIGGTVTYARAKKAHRVLQGLSDADYVLETDAPDMPISGFQGQVNSPERLPLIAQEVANLRQQTVTHVTYHTTANLMRVLPRWHEV